MTKKTEIQLLLRDCLDRKENARRRLYDLYVDRLYNTTQRITNNHHDTEDVLQQAFIKVFQKLDTYDVKHGTVFSWMCRICINAAISHLRKKKINFLEVTDHNISSKKDSNILDHMTLDYIAVAINKLSDAQRIIFTLYEIEGYNHHEISKRLGISTPTSRSYLSRAKSKLQSMIALEIEKINSL